MGALLAYLPTTLAVAGALARESFSSVRAWGDLAALLELTCCRVRFYSHAVISASLAIQMAINPGMRQLSGSPHPSPRFPVYRGLELLPDWRP